MALESEADELYYGGAAGGGKTDLLLGTPISGKGHRHSIVFRKEYPQLMGIEERARAMYGRFGTYNGSDKFWRLTKREHEPVIEFAAAKDDQALERFMGRAHDFIGFDEIPHFTEFQYRFLTGWLRTPVVGQRTRIIAAGNPPLDADGEWVIEYWGPWLKEGHPNPALPGELRWFARIDDKDVEVPDGSPIEHKGETIRPLSRTFIPARIEDNPILMATNYKARLQSFPEPMRSQLLMGLFHVQREIPNRVFPNYEDARNLNAAVPYDRDRVVYVTFDFNVTPATFTLSHELVFGEYPQGEEGAAHLGFFAEAYIKEGYDATQLAMLAILGKDRHGKVPEGLAVPENFEGLIKHNNRVIIYGDASGGQATMVSPDNRTLWAYITSAFEANMPGRFSLDVPAANPSQILSAMTVNYKCMSVGGKPSLWFHPRCKHTRRDMRFNVWKNKPGAKVTVEIDKSDPAMTHIGDQVRYIVHRRYGAEMKRKQSAARPAAWEASLAANLPSSFGGGFPWDVR